MSAPERLLEEAKRLEAARNFREAEQRYSQYINAVSSRDFDKSDEERDRKLALAFNNRGLLKYLMVDFDAAIQDFTEAVGLDPELAVAYYNRGLVHYRLGQFELALEDLGESHRLDPGFESTNDALHQTLLDRNAWKACSSGESVTSMQS